MSVRYRDDYADYVDYGDQLHDRDPESNTDPQQFVQDTKRWSYHLANDPYGGDVGNWALQYYNNPNIDPGAAIQNQISSARRAWGDLAPDDDIGVMQMLATGQSPQRPQTPAQAWNSAPATTPAIELPPIAPPPSQAPPPASTERTRTPEQKALLDLLMQRARQGTSIGRDDPNVRAQVDPMVAQMTRANREYQDSLAEKAGASGRLVNLEGDQRMAAERLGQQAATLEGQTIGREMDARRQEIEQALQTWGGLLDSESRLELQRELAYLSDATQRYSIGTQNDQFLRELALREWDTRNRWDYNWLLG